MDQQINDYRKVRQHLDVEMPHVGLLVLAAAIDRVAQSINELEIRVVTKKPEGL